MAYMDRFRIRGSHPLRPRFPARSATAPLCRSGGPTTPRGALPHPRFGLLRVRSPLLAQSLLFSLPAGTGMFRFPAFAQSACADCGRLAPPGFPHSDIRGSTGICPSPRLFAACHVLRRLREPQASPMRPSLLSFFLHFPAVPQGSRGAAPAKGFRLTILFILFARFSFDFASSQFLVVNLSFAFPIIPTGTIGAYPTCQ